MNGVHAVCFVRIVGYTLVMICLYKYSQLRIIIKFLNN